MADPAWGAASSPSDEDTARTLCAFRLTEPPPTQRRRPLRTQQPCSESNDEMPQLNGQYSSNGTYHVMPTRRDEAASMLLGMNTPSTSIDNWHRQQQCAIQEQQRELQTQINEQRQREVQAQLQRMEAQIWQQEEVQRQQVQAQRLVEKTLQPRYSTAGGLDRTGCNEVHTSCASIPCFHGGEDQKTAMHCGVHQSGQLYNARAGCNEQLPIRTTTASIPGHSYMSDYSENLRAGVSMNRNDGVFAVQQDLQTVQSHLQARNSENLAISAVHEWERNNLMLLAGTQSDRTKVSGMQTMQRYIQQQPLQPQPYYPAEINQRSCQVIGTLGPTSGSSLDDAFLDGIMQHFAASAAGSATTADTSARSNAVFVEAREDKAIFNAISAQSRIQNGAEVQIQRQINAQSKPPIPPSGAAVVPGVSLAPQAVRLLNMRDILNDEDGSSKVGSSRKNRPPGGKQKQAPPKRKMPRKKTPAKRQKMLEQESVRNVQQLPTNRPAGALLPGQSANGVSASASALTTKPCTPMHLAFLESRAARASEQAAGTINTRPSISMISTPQSQSLLVTPVVQLSTKFANRNIAAYEGANPVNRKMVDATSDMCNPSAAYRSIQQQTRTPPQDTARLEEQLANFSQPSTFEVKQRTNKPNTLLTRPTNVRDSAIDKAFGQHRRQQSSPKVSVSSKVAKSVQSSTKLDVVEKGKDVIIPKKISRAKRSLARLIPPTAAGREQQVRGMLPSVAPATVTHTPIVSAFPRMQNRTMVIFCKRDFMRYQAAKIWRKYQEQLKKHEEWREVRVAGKRTRYLNSRYDDEIRRAHRKTYTRSGRLRRKLLQEKEGIRSYKASLVTDGSTSVGRVASSCVSNNETDEMISPARERRGVIASADPRNASDDCSLSGKRGVADGVESSVTNYASQPAGTN